MSSARLLSVAALVVGMMASNAIPFAEAALAQDRPAYGHYRRSSQPAPAPAFRSAPRMVVPQRQFVRPPQVARHAPPQIRHVAPPPVRYSTPAPRHHREGRRGYGWRPGAYGAAAVGTVIVGSRFARASRSDLQRCADRFESFDWDDGTIENEDGEREICPYLQ